MGCKDIIASRHLISNNVVFLARVDSDEHMQPHFMLRNSSRCGSYYNEPFFSLLDEQAHCLRNSCV